MLKEGQVEKPASKLHEWRKHGILLQLPILLFAGGAIRLSGLVAKATIKPKPEGPPTPLAGASCKPVHLCIAYGRDGNPRAGIRGSAAGWRFQLATRRPIDCNVRMLDADGFCLRFGPYEPPTCQVGDSLTCPIRGRIKVVAFSEGPIRWPLTALPDGSIPFHIVCGDLKRALRREHAPELARAWGVSQSTVSRWRRALQEPAYRAQLRRAYHTSKVRSLLGTRHSPETRARMSASHRARWERRHAAGEGWQTKWDGLLGTMSDAELAKRLGVKQEMVFRRRHALDIPGHGPQGLGGRERTPDEDAMLGRMPDHEVAELLGCSMGVVFGRRRKLRVPPCCKSRNGKSRSGRSRKARK
jgi:hypothetical protein